MEASSAPHVQKQLTYSCRYDVPPSTKRHPKPRPPVAGAPRPTRRRPSSPPTNNDESSNASKAVRDASPYVLRPVVSTVDAATGRNLLHSGVGYDALVSLIAWNGERHNPVVMARSLVSDVLGSAVAACAQGGTAAADPVEAVYEASIPDVSVSPLSPHSPHGPSERLQADNEVDPLGCLTSDQQPSGDSFHRRSYSRSTATCSPEASGTTATPHDRTTSPLLPGEVGASGSSASMQRNASWPPQPKHDSSMHVTVSYDAEHESSPSSVTAVDNMRTDSSGCQSVVVRSPDDAVSILLAEHRLRASMEVAEEQAWLADVVRPWEAIAFGPDDPTCYVSVAVEEAARRRKQSFQHAMRAHLIQRLVATENVGRAMSVMDAEDGAFQEMSQAFRKRARELRGLEPLRRALLRYAYRRRRTNAACALRRQRLIYDEAACRAALTQLAGDAVLQRGAGFVAFEEAFYREHLLHLYAKVVGSTLFAWTWLHQRCALFPICFSYTLAHAPRMSGRVCNQSLFHLLSEREAFDRRAMVGAFDAFLDAMRARTVAAELASGEEPAVRQTVADEERARRRMLASTRARVTAMYQRRDVEFREMDLRSVVAAEWQASWTEHIATKCSPGR